MSETTKAPEEWSTHERWADAPRCAVETCRQPLTHPDSVRDKVCRRPGEAASARPRRRPDPRRPLPVVLYPRRRGLAGVAVPGPA